MRAGKPDVNTDTKLGLYGSSNNKIVIFWFVKNTLNNKLINVQYIISQVQVEE